MMKKVCLFLSFVFSVQLAMAIPVQSVSQKDKTKNYSTEVVTKDLTKKEIRKAAKLEKRKARKIKKVQSIIDRIVEDKILLVGLSSVVVGGLLAFLSHYMFLGLGFFTWLAIALVLVGLGLVIYSLIKNKA